jgi:hypothetical protein
MICFGPWQLVLLFVLVYWLWSYTEKHRDR